MSVIVLNETVIHYESLGRGRPILFLHTWVGSWRYWVPSLQAAAVSHSAYALDFYGFGDTFRDPRLYSIETQAALIGAFMDEMGMDRIAVVGHGLGALVGLQFAGMHPRRVARFVAVSLMLDSSTPHEGLLTSEPNQVLSLLDARGLHARELLPDTLAMDPRAVRLVPDALQIERSLSAIRASGIPMLIINGANDPLRQASGKEDPPGLGPQVHEVVFPESGHFPMLDAADSFHRLVMDFLALDSGASPRELRLKEEWRRRVR